MAPEIGLISFRTFEKQTHEQDATSPQGLTLSDVSRLPSYGTFMEIEDVKVEVAKFLVQGSKEFTEPGLEPRR